jgi:hypothetical protein
MKKLITRIVAVLIVGFAVVSCATTAKSNKKASENQSATGAKPGYFTSKICSALTIADLKNIQYYISEAITLTKDETVWEPEVSSGKVVIKEGSKSNEVTIAGQTPGHLILTKDSILGISFELNNPGAILYFKPGTQDGLY